MANCPICDRELHSHHCSCGWIEDRNTPVLQRFSQAHRPFVKEVVSRSNPVVAESAIEKMKHILGKRVLTESEQEALDERIAIQQESS